ncbi:MAG: S41 family peptidase, partial [Acidobacteriota bacterium]|nr:S41 family peptidase [Acidobacteriota bacterium]
MLKKILFYLILFALPANFYENSFGQTKKTPRRIITSAAPVAKPQILTAQKLTPEQKRRLDSFHIVWQTIKDYYFDQTFNGLNWENIKSEYEPKVLNLQTDSQLNYLLQEMINRLNRSHFAIVSPEVASEIEKAKAKAKVKKTDPLNKTLEADDSKEDETEESDDDLNSKYGIGIDVRILNNQVVITKVEKDSPAEKSGLKTGFVIEKINDVSLNEFVEKIHLYGAYAKSVQKLLPLEILTWFINGEKDTILNLTYLDEKDEPKQVNIKREKLDGQLLTLIQSLPKQFFRFETALIGEDVGYIKFNLFVLDLSEKFCSAISQFKDKKAIIIDLRGNLGGSYGVLMGISGLLTDKDFVIGTEINKISRTIRIIHPHRKNYKGKIIVLTDNLSYSAAEIFAAALQENNRAIVIGERSAGEALPALTQILPTGAIFLYPVANFETPKGNLLEGKGIEPNILIALDRKSLLAGNDIQLQSALDYLKADLKPAEQNKT